MEKCLPCFGDDSPEARERKFQNKVNEDIKKGNLSILVQKWG